MYNAPRAYLLGYLMLPASPSIHTCICEINKYSWRRQQAIGWNEAIEVSLPQVHSIPVKNVRSRDEGGATGVEDMIHLRLYLCS